MKASVPEEQFITSLRNGKLGLFRMQMTRDQIEFMLSNEENFCRTDYGSLGIGQVEMLFYENTSLLMRVKIRLDYWNGVQSWQKLLNLPWTDWVARQPLATVKQLLESANLPFRLVEYTDDGWGVLLLRSPASIQIFYNGSEAPDSFYLNFHQPDLMMSTVRSLENFHI